MAGKKSEPKQEEQSPFEVNIGDHLFPNKPGKLEMGERWRKMLATTAPYTVSGEWKAMAHDEDDEDFFIEVPLDRWHVVGGSGAYTPKEQTKPTLRKGDVVQLRHCPKYAAIETHTAKLTGEPFKAFGRWQAPITYRCLGRQTAMYDCDKMAYIGHSTAGITLNKVKDKLKFMKNLSKGSIIALVICVFVAILGLMAAGNYNDMNRARNQVRNAASTIETRQTERYDLIDNIVNSVQGSMAQESDVFKGIADARRVAGNAAPGSAEEAQAQENLNNQTNQLVAVVPRLQEAYPDLKSVDQVKDLITQLQKSAGDIRIARDGYNTTATNYNTNITSFPKTIFAGIFNFDEAKLYQASAEEKKNPTVNFDKKGQ